MQLLTSPDYSLVVHQQNNTTLYTRKLNYEVYCPIAKAG